MTRNVTVFGGTGFLGRRVVRHLREGGFTVWIASRHPARSRELFNDNDPQLLSVAANIQDERSIRSAICGAFGVVNAVSLYVEHAGATFHSVHIAAAGRLARLAREAGIQRLMHLSGIGADAMSASPYIRSRGEGELAVREAFPDATLIRPAVMFGPDDEETRGTIIECGGPRVYTYEELLRTVAQSATLQVRLFPLPFTAWHALAWMAEALPRPPLTRNQVELMQIHSVTCQGSRGFADLGISPRGMEQTLQTLLRADVAA